MAGRCCPAFIWDSTIKYPADVGQSRYAESAEGLQIWDGLECYERSGPFKFGLKGWGKASDLHKRISIMAAHLLFHVGNYRIAKRKRPTIWLV